MKKYFQNFKSIDDLHAAFDIPSTAVSDEEVLFAYYGYESWSGYATVLFERGGKLYEVTASHCSCNGLENGWNPDEVTWEQLGMRPVSPFYLSGDKDDAKEALRELIETHTHHA